MDGFMKKASDALGGNPQVAEYLKQAEGFLSSHHQSSNSSSQQSDHTPSAPPANPATHSQGQSGEVHGGASGNNAHAKVNYGELLSNAKTLYQGLQDKKSGKAGITNHQMAEAASNVLRAAGSAGFSKDSPYGQYIEKAQVYLQHYGRSQKDAAAATLGSDAGHMPKPY